MTDARSFIKMLSAQAAGDAEYLGWVFARFSEWESVNASDLADRLRTDSTTLLDLSLCIRPRAETFAADVRVIAERFGVDDAALAMVVRHVEVLETMRSRGAASADQGLLLAARIRSTRRSRPETGQRDRSTDEDA